MKQLIPELAAMVATMTAQMAKQRKRSMRYVPSKQTYDICQYRGEGGCMCAVGALIPDELYDPKVEQAIHRLFSWTYDEEAIKDAKASDLADHLEPSARLVRHLASMAPSISHRALLAFLAICQRFHDSPRKEDEQYTYESVMAAAPADISDETLQERLTKRLVGFLATDNSYQEFWVKP